MLRWEGRRDSQIPCREATVKAGPPPQLQPHHHHVPGNLCLTDHSIPFGSELPIPQGAAAPPSDIKY